MRAEKQGHFSPPAVGGISLLVVFAVLCLTVFALLSLSTVRADERLSLASAQAVSDYYAADGAAQEILARLQGGEMPEGVRREGDFYTYSCEISQTQRLVVELERRDGYFAVVRWQAVPAETWRADGSLSVWDGEDS